jgi:Protein of unknown function (DUF4199)
MENNKSIVQGASLAKSTIPYGVIFGIILVLEFVLSYTLELNSAENKGIGIVMGLMNNLILPFLFIFLACNNYKNKLNGGYISFGQCLKGGVSTMVLAALVSSVITSIFYLIIPKAKEQILEQTKISLASQPGMTSEQMKMSLEFTEIFLRPYALIPISIIMYAIIGLIISLIVGAIIKKDNPGAFN